MRVKVQTVAIAFLLCAVVVPSRGHADEIEDAAALKVLDSTYQEFVAGNAEEARRTGAFDLIHRVIERINLSHSEPVEVRELARFAEKGLHDASVGPGATAPEQLATGAIDALLLRIADPYASFNDRKIRPRGQRLGNVGIEAAIENGLVKVIAPLEGGPAQKAGVLPGDLILEVDHVSVRGLSLPAAMKHLEGPLGSEALLDIRREDRTRHRIKVPRTRFRIRELRYQTLGRIAYLRIAFFGPDTEKLLRKALAAIRKDIGGGEPTGYIVDLRNNPGGLVGQAILLADAFLEDGMIVETRGRDKKGARIFKAYRGDFTNGRPIIVLINRGSASASEILAAALKDNDRALLMGDRSYGKGVVQTVYPFGAWGQIRFTTHKYMTASGKQFHRIGVLPDIFIGSDPRPKYGTRTVDIRRCPAAGAAHDRMLGCAILLLESQDGIEGFLERLPEADAG